MPQRHRRGSRLQEVVYLPGHGTAGTADDWPVFYAFRQATIHSVRWVPQAAVTGAATNNFALEVRNRGTDGTGTTQLGIVTFASGTNAVAYDALDVVTSDKNVDAGGVVEARKVINGTGLAMPDGCLVIEYSHPYETY